MKPIIIFTQKDENGNICMSAEKFEKYIQTAYENGVKDGKRENQTYFTIPNNYRDYINSSSNPHGLVQDCVVTAKNGNNS